jgi:hypothetical protein
MQKIGSFGKLALFCKFFCPRSDKFPISAFLFFIRNKLTNKELGQHRKFQQKFFRLARCLRVNYCSGLLYLPTPTSERIVKKVPQRVQYKKYLFPAFSSQHIYQSLLNTFSFHRLCRTF